MEPQPTTTTTTTTAVSSGNSSKTPTPPALRRRRVRTTNENRTTAVLSRAAKTEFGSVVSSAVDRLQRKHGYAPERAARAILQEITAKAFEKAAASPSAASSESVGDDDDDNNNVKRRNDNQEDQLYGLMQKLQIGSDQALRVLTVSLAIEEMCRQNGQTPAEALTDLTNHLRTANLLERSGDDDATTTRVSRITGDEDAGLTTTASSGIPPATAVKPAKTRPRPMESSSRSARSHKKPKLANTAGSAVASTAAARPRADSLSNDVTAKLEDSKVAAAVGPSAAAAPSQATLAKPATPALSRNVSTSSNNNNNKRGEPSGGTTMVSSSNNKRARHVVGSNNGPNAAVVATTMPRHS